MYGTNPTRKQHLDPAGLLRVHSIFRTIQGEGPLAGTPAIFVRLWGCNLKCYWCDTDFEDHYEELMPEQVAETIAVLINEDDMNTVVITGGEPFRQNLTPLVNTLWEQWGYRVQVETSGSLSNPDFPWSNNSVSVVCSPKTGKLHPDMVHADAWKYIVTKGQVDPEDGLPVMSTQVTGKEARIARPMNDGPVYVQPCDVTDIFRAAGNIETCIEVAQRHNYIFSYQVHKAIGVE